MKGEPIGQPMRVASTIQLGLAAPLRGPRAGPARADPERPARGQRNPLLGLLLRGPLLRGQLLRPRLPRRPAQRFGLFTALILSESVFRTIFAVLVAVGLLSGQSAVAIGIVAAPSLSPDRRPLRLRPPGAQEQAGAHPACPDAKRRTCRSEVRSTPIGVDSFEEFDRRRLRRRRARDHVQRTGLPQRRAADRPRPAGRGGGGLHLQRADDRPGAAAALPGGLDQHPAPPDQPPHQRPSPTATANSTTSVRMVLLGDRRLHRAASRSSS